MEKTKRDYRISYNLDNCYHTYIVEVYNEYEAMEQVLNRIPETSQDIFHGFKIERYIQPW